MAVQARLRTLIADWVWMPTKTLIKGMRTFDKIENRGYILIH